MTDPLMAYLVIPLVKIVVIVAVLAAKSLALPARTTMVVLPLTLRRPPGPPQAS